jgi:hypothetical protein
MNPYRSLVVSLSVTSLFAYGIVVGCSSDPEPAATPAADAGASSSDAATDGAIEGGAIKAPYRGTIDIVSDTAVVLDREGNPQIRNNASIAALFLRTQDGGATDLCTFEEVEGCIIQNCPGGVPEYKKAVSAGDITLEGPTVPGGSVKVQPTDTGIYETYGGRDALWKEGEDVKVTAAGKTGGVPAFDTSLPTPVPFILKAPSLVTDGGSFPLSRADDFAFEWTFDTNVIASDDAGTGDASTGGAVFVPEGLELRAEFRDEGAKTQVACHYRAQGTESTATVPAAALQKLAKGFGTLKISAVSRKTVVAGDFGVVVTLSSIGTGAESGESLARIEYR